MTISEKKNLFHNVGVFLLGILNTFLGNIFIYLKELKLKC